MKKKVADSYHHKPLITRTDLKKVFDTLLSEKLTVSEGGMQLRHFEKRFASYHKRRDALMYANDSLALYAVLRDLGIKKDDEVLISSFAESFVAETILFMGARPIFVDCLPNTLLMDLKKAESLINKSTCALVYSYPFGYGDTLALRNWMDNAQQICPVIEDATQALGCSYFFKNQWFPVGTVGDYSFFSLSPSRVLTSAKGAVVLSKNNERIVHLSHFRGCEGSRGSDDKLQLIPRLDFVPTEIEASLAMSQFSILEKNLERRNYIAQQFKQAFPEQSDSFFMALPQHFSFNHYAYVMLFPTYQEKLDVKSSFEQSGIGSVEEVENIACLKTLVGSTTASNATNQTKERDNNLTNTLKVLSRTLVFSFSLDISDNHIKKMISLLSSLNKMQLTKKS